MPGPSSLHRYILSELRNTVIIPAQNNAGHHRTVQESTGQCRTAQGSAGSSERSTGWHCREAQDGSAGKDMAVQDSVARRLEVWDGACTDFDRKVLCGKVLQSSLAYYATAHI